ncbi:MAG: polyribonucleotide nucleotidyltransferase [Candidatus Wildermuthbacteria bacterium RIFCSPLOWO2_01_FULL_47_18]|uniref:Polyribonucleotide nucleotidyltransferase n=2 Tax=Candidatus Wildermuthiibacteriota TaxID=1817923 RepID=A0A1G2RGH1_9BACT|nr:MAG: polyribonucleotide nucleotidyltransferase [Candidatus Wildermuthbacteria bacterium RIFCSPHIGHO2_02_FULL_48_16]OHA71935.1 MAG: polyribonucleotide nucleotidyltransferase [Candidatus Wildermuthbacteria bacterium RIFCSPLOWO2_01_FULL_47_18]
MASPSTIKLGDHEISFEITPLAEQANGAVMMRMGDTMLLVTAVMAKRLLPNQGFFPLSVEYEERFYAAGKILGSRFVRREGRPTDEAILTARLVDRAIRPLFPSQLRNEIQVIATCLSWDATYDPDILGLLGASFALSISDIPWKGPLGALRIGRIDNAFVVNPSYEQRTKSDLDLVFAGIKHEGDLVINMIEGSGKEVGEAVMIEALQFAKPYMLQVIEFQEQLAKEVRKEKLPLVEAVKDEALKQEIQTFLGAKLKTALFQGDKKARMEQVDLVKEELLLSLSEKYDDPAKISFVKDFFEEEINRQVHEAALKEGKRVDDRKLDQIRDLKGSAGILPRTHGSGLFERGQTKTLSILTLGAPGDQKLLEGMEFIGKKRFLHHYNFPPYAPGEVKPMRGPGRREIGHGMLAEKALLPVIPQVTDFPYTIRIVTEVVSSNGSTSMASTCSSSLALLDAGVPIKRAVAGISMGLMQDEKGNYALLTDIQGPEDHHGDMDFKVAGTKEGITALQLDVKINGINEKIFKEALEGAKKARMKILDEVIRPILENPRPSLSPFAPKIYVLQIDPEKIGMVIGSGGKTINKIVEDYGVEIDIDDTGEVFVTGTDEEKSKQAVEVIKNIVHEVQVGEFYTGKVKRILDFGAFVEFTPGQEGLVHISQLDTKRVAKVTDVVNVGDTVRVKVVGIDELGRVNLSVKDAKEHGNQTPSA